MTPCICRFQSLVSAFVETFDNDVKALRKVESKADVLEVQKVVLELPRFATMLDNEQSIFKKHWDSIWNSFFESVTKKLRLVVGSSGQEQDISDSIAFLQAARKLLQQQKAHIESLSAATSSPLPAPSETSVSRAPPAERRSKQSRPANRSGKGMTPTSTLSGDGNAASARSPGAAGWLGTAVGYMLGGPAQKEDNDPENAEEDFEDAVEEVDFEDFEDATQLEGAAGQADSPARHAVSNVHTPAPTST